MYINVLFLKAVFPPINFTITMPLTWPGLSQDQVDDQSGRGRWSGSTGKRANGGTAPLKLRKIFHQKWQNGDLMGIYAIEMVI